MQRRVVRLCGALRGLGEGEQAGSLGRMDVDDGRGGVALVSGAHEGRRRRRREVVWLVNEEHGAGGEEREKRGGRRASVESGV